MWDFLLSTKGTFAMVITGLFCIYFVAMRAKHRERESIGSGHDTAASADIAIDSPAAGASVDLHVVVTGRVTRAGCVHVWVRTGYDQWWPKEAPVSNGRFSVRRQIGLPERMSGKSFTLVATVNAIGVSGKRMSNLPRSEATSETVYVRRR
jgi:hypothetical protein